MSATSSQHQKAQKIVSSIWELYSLMNEKAMKLDQAQRLLLKIIDEFDSMSVRQYRSGRLPSIEAARRFLESRNLEAC